MTAHPATNGDVAGERMYGATQVSLDDAERLFSGSQMAGDVFAHLREALAELARLREAVEACAVEFDRRANENRGLALARVSAFSEAAETVRSKLVNP